MTEANLGQLSQEKLGFEIANSQDINRALNKIKRGEIFDIDEKIGILKIILEVSKQQNIEWGAATFKSFLQIFQAISRNHGNQSDYKIDLQRILHAFEECISKTKFQNTKRTIRDDIARLLQTQPNYATPSSGAARASRAYPISR